MTAWTRSWGIAAVIPAAANFEAATPAAAAAASEQQQLSSSTASCNVVETELVIEEHCMQQQHNELSARAFGYCVNTTGRLSL